MARSTFSALGAYEGTTRNRVWSTGTMRAHTPGPTPLSLSVIGVPSSAGSYAPGQERTPRVLREAGLIAALIERTGIDVTDCGDLPLQVWAPDRVRPLAQNAPEVVASVVELTDRVYSEVSGGRRVLVIGGNCTIATGAVAGVQRHTGTPCGLVYVDRHFDMNTPETTVQGALDWMGLGHGFDLPGALPEFASAFDDRPLLRKRQVAFLGVDPAEGTVFEREHVLRLQLDVTTQQELIAAPEAAARDALAALTHDHFAVHVDVDVLDFTDAPLSENSSGRNQGPTLDQLTTALSALVADPRWRVLTIGEINPSRAAGAPHMISRFNEVLADVVACAAASAR